jgi:hypothetical protein
MTHRFLTTNSYTFDDGFNTFVNVTKQCITCGGVWDGTAPESSSDYIPVYSLRGESPTGCEPVFGSTLHGGENSAIREFFKIPCNCLFCEG